jgi:O-antigen ligase
VNRDRALYVLSRSPVVLAILAIPILYLPFADNLSHALVHTFRLFMIFSFALAVLLSMSILQFFSLLQILTLTLTLPYAYALYTNSSFEVVDISHIENVLNYKNHVGVIGALAAVCSFWMIGERRRIVLSACGLTFSLFVVFALSQSATGIVIAVVGLGVLLLRQAMQSFKVSTAARFYMSLSLFISATLVICGFLGYVMISSEQILEVLGRDATFTGRLDIWFQSYALILDRPIFGYGYEILEDDTGTSPVYIRDFLTHLHNSWLNIALQFGMLGIILHLIAYGKIWMQSRVFSAFDLNMGALFLALLSILIVHSVVESSFMMSRGELSFLTFVLLLAPVEPKPRTLFD